MSVQRVSRRDFVKWTGTASAGLALGVHVPFGQRGLEAAVAAEVFKPNAFVAVEPNGLVRIWIKHVEMGQGIDTALPMIIADELDAEWDRLEIVRPVADPALGRQMTAGSGSIRNGWEEMRRAGASARAMLVEAAARRWGVDASTLRTGPGRVLHPDGRALAYGDLAEEAAALPVPAEPPLKDPADFRIIGTPVPRTDTRAKVTGEARFGIDTRVPGMKFATVLHCPHFGGTVGRVDDAAARAVPGVVDVFRVSNGVAVVADHTWAAFQGARALEVEWVGGFRGSSASIADEHAVKLRDGPVRVSEDQGDAEGVLARAERVIEATYSVPYLAHACMEPMNCAVHVREDACELWVPTQNPGGARSTAARLTGLPEEAVTAHITFLGGGFGRRGEDDFVTDAVEVAMQAGVPVLTTWTREEDMQHDFYRPAATSRFRAALDARGEPVAWSNRIVCASIIGRGRPLPEGRVDFTAVEGAANLPYHVPNRKVEWAEADASVPVGWWRSVGSSHNAFHTESFIDELAHAAGKDPYLYRRQLAAEHPRHVGVLASVAERARYGVGVPAGRAHGIAVAECFGSYVAQVAEVSLDDAARPVVHKVWCVVDCGRYVNPDTVRAQMEGAIVYGLSAALHEAITLEDGRVVQSNFDDFDALRLREMPEIDVHILESNEAPGGVGEPGTPPIAPAVTNALFALTGVRVRTLPIPQDAFQQARQG
ncbi:MAG: xanthine dehydrogenase family protein molybdopterin-binding subunit [Gemmatimonadetes bacterium]|nr:xanthine dehydrogenase family protein molybdopterin-binding subunit [Gemmatimonadota bacterium]